MTSGYTGSDYPRQRLVPRASDITWGVSEYLQLAGRPPHNLYGQTSLHCSVRAASYLPVAMSA